MLSLAAGPVLGAFLTGVLTTRVGSRAMLTGMIAGSRRCSSYGGRARAPGPGTRSSARAATSLSRARRIVFAMPRRRRCLTASPPPRTILRDAIAEHAFPGRCDRVGRADGCCGAIVFGTLTYDPDAAAATPTRSSISPPSPR